MAMPAKIIKQLPSSLGAPTTNRRPASCVPSVHTFASRSQPSQDAGAVLACPISERQATHGADGRCVRPHHMISPSSQLMQVHHHRARQAEELRQREDLLLGCPVLFDDPTRG